MDILLWRHAEAEAATDGIPDLRRPLTPHGQKQALKMAQWLKKHAPDHLRILVSPALRCQQTAQASGLPFETDPCLGPDRRVEDLLASIGWPDDWQSKKLSSAVLVVGHQPTLGRVVAHLLSENKTNWPIKKGALWWLSGQNQSNTMPTATFSVKTVIAPDLL